MREHRRTKQWIEVEKSAVATTTPRCARVLMGTRWGRAMPARSSSRAAHLLQRVRARLLANGGAATRPRHINNFDGRSIEAPPEAFDTSARSRKLSWSHSGPGWRISMATIRKRRDKWQSELDKQTYGPSPNHLGPSRRQVPGIHPSGISALNR